MIESYVENQPMLDVFGADSGCSSSCFPCGNAPQFFIEKFPDWKKSPHLAALEMRCVGGCVGGVEGV